MPRNITVTFSDGSQHVYQNAPDDVTPENVTARAQKQFPGLTVTALDGGRKVEAKPKAMSREDAIKATAREQVASQSAARDSKLGDGFLGEVGDVGAAIKASVANTFGIGPRIQARISAVKDGVPYDDALTYWREVNKAERDQSLTGDITGMLVGGGGVTGAGRALVRGAQMVPGAVQRAANVIDRATTLQRGQKLANAGKIVGGGAALGAAQAAGEGEDVATGALMGGAMAGGVTAAAKAGAGLVRGVARPFSRNINKAAQELIADSPDAIASRQAELSRRTGQNVPVVAALNDRDFKTVSDELLSKSDEANEIAKRETGKSIRGFMDRMIGHVNNAGKTAGAMNATVEDLVRLRSDTADEMMAPIQQEAIDIGRLRVDDVELSAIERIADRNLKPRLRAAFRATAGGDIGSKATIRELEDLRRALNSASDAAASNPGESKIYRDAAQSIVDLIKNQYGYKAYGDMIDTWAANSRMIEGFRTTASGKRISDITDKQLSDNLRTNEGRVGMKAGELFRQRERVGNTPSTAIAAARDFASEGKLTRQADPLNPDASQPGTVTENIGPTAAAQLADASDAEMQILQRMTRAGGVDINTADARALDSPSTLGYGAAILSGDSFASTKAGFVRSLIDKLTPRVPPFVAKNLTEMLFSNDPAQTQKALNALRRVGITDQVLNSMLIPATAGMAGGRSNGGEPPVIDVGTGQIIEPAPGPQSMDVSPEFDALASRVEMAESGGDQNAVSPKGAVGVMQVMPATAPEAAALAGVPFDEERYRTDPEYNRALGRAYLSEMLNQFDGDVALALAAYNAGPNAVRAALQNGDNWLAALPAETQEYVQKVLG